MKERPILFSGEMVRAILDGRKSQTRRVIKPQPEWHGRLAVFHPTDTDSGKTELVDVMHDYDSGLWEAGYPRWTGTNPYGQLGDRLWVRETFVIESNFNIDTEGYEPPFHDGRPIRRDSHIEYGDWWEQPHYRATDPTPELAYEDTDEPTVRWRPSIFMPRWASRLLVEITGIGVERVQDVSEADAKAEGAPCGWYERDTLDGPEKVPTDYRSGYHALWDSINAKRGFGWDVNPWVWVVEFKRVQP